MVCVCVCLSVCVSVCVNLCVCDRKLHAVLCYLKLQKNQTKQINISQANFQKLRSQKPSTVI